MSKNTTIGLVVLVLAILLGWYFLQSQKTQAPTPVPQASPQIPATESAQPSEAIDENVVKVSTSGFLPKDITIQAGESVTWMNEDNENHQVLSAVHPTHQLYPPLNTVELLKTGEKKSLSFPTAGTYKYHDHLNPSFTGSVTVE